jgi:hypothetical protein
VRREEEVQGDGPAIKFRLCLGGARVCLSVTRDHPRVSSHWPMSSRSETCQ